jgi:hypothetical protein
MISSISLSFFDFLPGLILMWFLFVLFYWGGASRVKDLNNYYIPISYQYQYLYDMEYLPFTISLLFIIFIPFYVKFYTGSDLVFCVSNYFKGNSNYFLYQKYFIEQNLSEMSFTKLPYIISYGIMKFLFISTIFRIFVYNKYIKKSEVLPILIMVIGTFLIAIARGTSFEYFEILFLLSCALLLRGKTIVTINIYSKKKLFYLLALGFFTAILFGYTINQRGYFSKYTSELYYDPNAFLNKILPFFGFLTYQLSGYFLFGIFVATMALKEIVFISDYNFWVALFPSGTNYRDILKAKIDFGCAWTPDVIFFISQFGLIISTMLMFFLGYYSRKLYSEIIEGSVLSAVLFYFITYSMVSLPVGNFIFISSSNELSIVFAVLLYTTRKRNSFIHKYFKIKKINN